MRHNSKRHNTIIFLFIGLFIVSSTALGEVKNKKTSKKNENKIVSTKKPVVKKTSKIVKKGVSKDSAPGKNYTEKDFAPKTKEESYGWLVFKTIFVMGGLVAAFYLFFQFVTKKSGIQVMGQEVVQILSIVPIGQNKYLQVVDMAGKILVLGVSDNNINLITEISSKDEIDRIRMLSSKSRGQAENNFQEYLTTQVGKVSDFIKKKTGKDADNAGFSGPDRSESSGVNMDYLKEQRDRLKRLNGHDEKK